jgi:putative hydrolase of the HAD superfamily
MPCKQLIIFDLDDTLVDTSDIYWRARSTFVEKLTEYGLEAEKIIEEFEKIDSINIKTLGFAPNRYEKSMLDTYQHFVSQGELSLSSADEIISCINFCSRIIEEAIPELIEGAKYLLDWASRYFKLALLTRGEDYLQKKKLCRTGLYRYFDLDFIRVVSKKDANTFKQFLDCVGYHPDNTWIVGDSIKSDINPGIEIGAICVLYIYRHHSYYWSQEHGCSSLGSFYKTNSLQQIKEILESPLKFQMVTEA